MLLAVDIRPVNVPTLFPTRWCVLTSIENPPGGRIYFVEGANLGLVKIGYATRVLRRISELTTGCPVRLELRAIAIGTFDDERRLHRRFAHLRKHGEWFRLDAELRALIARHALPEPIYFTGPEIEPPWFREIVVEEDTP